MKIPTDQMNQGITRTIIVTIDPEKAKAFGVRAGEKQRTHLFLMGYSRFCNYIPGLFFNIIDTTDLTIKVSTNVCVACLMDLVDFLKPYGVVFSDFSQ